MNPKPEERERERGSTSNRLIFQTVRLYPSRLTRDHLVISVLVYFIAMLSDLGEKEAEIDRERWGFAWEDQPSVPMLLLINSSVNLSPDFESPFNASLCVSLISILLTAMLYGRAFLYFGFS